MPLEPDDDLRWPAFLYVSGELDDDARSAFEALLDRDQEAREAVAEAVGIIEAVAASPPGLGSAPARPLRLPARRRLAGLAAAACLLAASVPALQSLRPSPVETPAPAEVALAWSGLLDERYGMSGDPELMSWIGMTPNPEAPDVVPTGEGATSPPSWLLAATSAPDPDQPETHED